MISWYVMPEIQTKKVSAFLGVYGGGHEGFRPSDIPAVPSSFVPRTPTEVLLLTVFLPNKGEVRGLQRTFDAWWEFTTAPDGLTKWRWESLKSDPEHLRLALGVEYTPGIRWVAFDPVVNKGVSPKDALVQATNSDTTLAGIEVIMAAALFPKWALSWDGDESAGPSLSGLQFDYEARGWSHVPRLCRFDDEGELGLDACWAGGAIDDSSSPVVREC